MIISIYSTVTDYQPCILRKLLILKKRFLSITMFDRTIKYPVWNTGKVTTHISYKTTTGKSPFFYYYFISLYIEFVRFRLCLQTNTWNRTVVNLKCRSRRSAINLSFRFSQRVRTSTLFELLTRSRWTRRRNVLTQEIMFRANRLHSTSE